MPTASLRPSFDYEDAGYQLTELVKVNFYLNDKDVEELTMICHVSRARETARKVCLKLKDTVPRQQFMISVQGKVNQKVIARENIKAYRKDVTAKCYGGDISRKTKLLKRQAEGKKRLRKIGNIDVPKDAFIKAKVCNKRDWAWPRAQVWMLRRLEEEGSGCTTRSD
ncbi:hypothetical protein RRG08_005667 [Elysia crispata]|uniref:GTP-binding protein LepA C-terminal domain-containing protein n=1 Tax=Elysia crispata TaxID=231223 RepID=A0AAE0YCZ0_9GAST|nr:hypothetical protein RRG08_005667 [Elysia crispata]